MTVFAYRVCHLTSVHPADDIRIFHKQCVSLAALGYDVHLVAQGSIAAGPKGVTHHPLPVSPREGRLKRMLFGSWRTYQLAKQTQATLFHFHDPELLLYGLLLKWQGKKVIYDAHEDLPRDVMIKPWIPWPFRRLTAWVVEKIEHGVARHLDAVVTATPFIRQRFQAHGARAVDVKNYPDLTEFLTSRDPMRREGDEPQAMCYVGVLSAARGLYDMIQAAAILQRRLILAGSFPDCKTEQTALSLPGWSFVDYRGMVGRQGIQDIFAESFVGLCLLHPHPSLKNALPIKLFEYMAAGLPVLSSSFSAWKAIIESAQCGVCVDPLDQHAIVEGVEAMLNNPEWAQEMGKRGRDVVFKHYSWRGEAMRLEDLYCQIGLCKRGNSW